MRSDAMLECVGPARPRVKHGRLIMYYDGRSKNPKSLLRQEPLLYIHILILILILLAIIFVTHELMTCALPSNFHTIHIQNYTYTIWIKCIICNDQGSLFIVLIILLVYLRNRLWQRSYHMVFIVCLDIKFHVCI